MYTSLTLYLNVSEVDIKKSVNMLQSLIFHDIRETKQNDDAFN